MLTKVKPNEKEISKANEKDELALRSLLYVPFEVWGTNHKKRVLNIKKHWHLFSVQESYLAPNSREVTINPAKGTNSATGLSTSGSQESPVRGIESFSSTLYQAVVIYFLMWSLLKKMVLVGSFILFFLHFLTSL